MKKNILFIICICSFVFTTSYAQYYRPENRAWRMSAHVGVDFTDTGLAARTSNMNSDYIPGEGCASVADEYGHLLFYTNGWKVWAANDSIMPHADTLNGAESLFSTSVTQGSLIVPTHKKGIYFLFILMNAGTTNAPNQLFCYKIDMSLNDGWGDIDTTFSLYHTLICDSLTEKMIAIPGCNDNIWVLVHSNNSPAFYSFEVDAADSLHAIPIISNYMDNTPPYSGGASWGGQIKASPLWDKVAIGTPYLATLHFDRVTGQLSDYTIIDNTLYGMWRSYTMEFSPNGKMLYRTLSIFDSLFQYNLAAPPNYNKTCIGKNGVSWNNLKLAPDSSIYMRSDYSGKYFSRIRYPDSPGVACGFEDTVSNLVLENPAYPGNSGIEIGLPNLVVFPVAEQDTFNLYLDTLLCTMPFTPVILTALPYYAQKVWSTGAVSDTIAVSEAGTYWVTYGNGCAQRVDTYKVRTILPPLSISYANGQLSATNIFTTYQWYKDGNMITGATAQSVNAAGDGVYKVVVSNGNSCTDSAKYVLEGSGVGSINAGSDISIYPNPAKDKVWIKCPVHCTVSITGVDGKVYYEGLSSSVPLDVSKCSNGMYYIVFRDHNKALLAVRKLVVMR